MARLKLKIPDDALSLHIEKIPVQICYINYGKHLGHDSLVSILHEARMRFFKKHGITDEISIGENIGFMIVGLTVNYIAEAFYGDELHVEILVSDVKKKACDFYYKVTKLMNGIEVLVAIASTTLLFIEWQSRKPVPIPQRFLKTLRDISRINLP